MMSFLLPHVTITDHKLTVPC